MKRTLAITIAGVILGAIVVAGSARLIFDERVHTVVIDREQIQQAIDRRLPVRKGSEPGQEVVLKNSRVLLRYGSDGIATSTEFDAIEHGGDTFPGLINSETGLRYDARLGTFFLRKPVIRGTRIQSVGGRSTRFPMNGACACVQELYADVPVHQIRDENLKEKLIKAIMGKVEWIDGRLVISFSY